MEAGDARAQAATGDDAGPAFFLVAYGPARRATVDAAEETRDWITGPRLARVASLLDERVTLRPLEGWLPECERSAPERFAEVARLLNRTMPPSTFFDGERENGAYLFEHEGVKVPYLALSEGIRSHIAWLADLLHHLHAAAPVGSGSALVDLPGVVLVDEVDQRLHPRWQLDVLSWISAAFPRLQLVVTSHSPLVTGGLRPANIAVLEIDEDADGASRPRSVADDVFGRSADGVLTSSYFDLASTRADPFRKHLRELVQMARSGDRDAPLELMRVLGDPSRMGKKGGRKKGKRKGGKGGKRGGGKGK